MHPAPKFPPPPSNRARLTATVAPLAANIGVFVATHLPVTPTCPPQTPAVPHLTATLTRLTAAETDRAAT